MPQTISIRTHSTGDASPLNDHRDTKSWVLDTIEMLLEVARQESDADGFGFYEFDQATEQFIPRSVRGMPVRTPRRPATPSENGSSVLTYPLKGVNGLAGTVDFAFTDPADAAPGYRQVLQHAVEAVEALLQSAGGTNFLVHLTARISELETRLATLKIRERAQGLLNRDTRYGRSEALNSHVNSVLQLSELEQFLSEKLRDAEQRLSERQIVSQAKADLQHKLGLTEEEAYIRLREVSRRTRTRLGEVAADVIAGRSSFAFARRLSA